MVAWQNIKYARQQQQQQQQQEEVVADDSICDESKCVSYGLYNHFNYSFSCYGDNIYYPFVCADGYIPRVVNTEPTLVAWNDFAYTFTEDKNLIYQYYTCCPPDLPINTTNVTRHCSNSTIVNYINEKEGGRMECKDDILRFPRQLKTNKFLASNNIESYMCCDSILDNENKTYALNDTECSPYIDKYYRLAEVFPSYFGAIDVRTCEQTEYPFVNLVEESDIINSEFRYKCCKTGPGPPPFLQDYGFKTTIYPQLVLSSIAVIFSTTLIVSLSIPLLRQAKRKQPRRSIRLLPIYSSYNLYLIYLAIPELILNIYIIVMYGSYANMKYNPNFHGYILVDWIRFFDDNTDSWYFEGAFALACSTACLYLNCVITRSIYTLLQKCHDIRPSGPPSLRKVTLEAICVLLFSIIIFISRFFIGRAALKAGNALDIDKADKILLVNFLLGMVVTFLFPIAFFCYVSFIIWYRGLMPSATGKTKQLFWYYVRIMVVCIAFFLPAMFLLNYGVWIDNYSGGVYIATGFVFIGLQPIVSTSMAMTKSDVRKYVIDLITLTYLFQKPVEDPRTITPN
jgi:hypothetical protein